jgi:hypothetical protein
VISQEIGNRLNLRFGLFHFGFGSFWRSGGLVVAGGVEGEVAQEFAGVGIDDADVEVLHEQQDALVGVVAADAGVVQAAVDAEGDDADFVDGVAVDAVVGVVIAAAGGAGFGVVVVDRGGGAVVWE